MIFGQIIRYFVRKRRQSAYPQREFAEAVSNLLEHFDTGNNLLDIPCGTGEIAFYLSQKTPKNVVAADIDPASIAQAKHLWGSSGVQFLQGDIFDVLRGQERLDVVCILNSLFLLPRTDELITLITQKMDTLSLLVLIVPNVSGPNFAAFQRLKPGVNTFQLAESDAEPYFNRFDLRVCWKEGIVFQPFYGRLDVRLLWLWRSWYLRRLHHEAAKKVHRIPNYFLFALQKRQESYWPSP